MTKSQIDRKLLKMRGWCPMCLKIVIGVNGGGLFPFCPKCDYPIQHINRAPSRKLLRKLP